VLDNPRWAVAPDLHKAFGSKRLIEIARPTAVTSPALKGGAWALPAVLERDYWRPIVEVQICMVRNSKAGTGIALWSLGEYRLTCSFHQHDMLYSLAQLRFDLHGH
jgi:hypothetical protein